MPCDAIATARAKMPVVLPGEVILKLLKSEFPDLVINSYEVGSQLNIYSTNGISLRRKWSFSRRLLAGSSSDSFSR